MSSIETIRGSFSIRINTDATSFIGHNTYTVATCGNGKSKFELHHESYRVPPSLLRELSDVITEANRLLLEARAAVNSANTIITTPTKAPRPLEYWINTTDSAYTTHAGRVGISAYMTYNPNADTSVYRFYSVERGEWINSTYSGRNSFSQTNAVWSTHKPDEYTLAHNGRITYNKALIATLVKRKDPVQFLKSDDNCLFALVLNGTRHSLFHITNVGTDYPGAFVSNLHTWTCDAAVGAVEQIDDMRLTPISLNDALTLRPHLRDAVAYRPDSDMAKNSVYFTRNFTTGEQLKWRYDSRTQAWQPFSPAINLDKGIPIDWAHPSNDGWSIGDSSVASLKDTYLKSLTPSGAEVLKSALASLPPVAFFKSTGHVTDPNSPYFYFAYVRRGLSQEYTVYQVTGGGSASLRDLASRGTYNTGSTPVGCPVVDKNFKAVSASEFSSKFPVLAAARLYSNNGPGITYTLDFLTQSHAMHARSAATKVLSCTRDDEWPWSDSSFPRWDSPSGGWSTDSTQFDYIHNEDNFKPAPKYLVPNIHFDEHGTFKFKPFYVAFYEKIGGQWMSYSGMFGTHTPTHLIGADSNGEGLTGYHTLDKVPTPIGYRLFDTTKNEWLQPAKDGITLFSTADGYTPMSGNEMRPWYGPSLVTK